MVCPPEAESRPRGSRVKKLGILNAALMREIAALSHFDSFALCDIGFPIPRDAVIIDLALTRGLPGMFQVLKAVCAEVVVESVTLMDAAPEANPRLDAAAKSVFRRQKIEYRGFEDFRRLAAGAKFFVRTGEDAPCSNLILVSASGALSRVERYDIPEEELEGFADARVPG